MVKSKTSLALHLRTYESAIENMLRRLHDQDVGDPSEIRYWLHRVQIHLKPCDLDQHIGDEFASLTGDVPLSEVHSRGGRAAPYINVYEAAGSVPLASRPQRDPHSGHHCNTRYGGCTDRDGPGHRCHSRSRGRAR
jgi:hypothetical protein